MNLTRLLSFISQTVIMWSALFLTSSSYSRQLPVPPGLQGDVRFWQDVFSKYKPYHCIYHDRAQLASIFLVTEIPKAMKNKTSFLRRQKDKIELALRMLGKGLPAKTRLQHRIVKGTPINLRNKNYWRKAAHRVRCQRGVNFTNSIARSRRHLPMIKKVFRRHNLPEDLAYLPHLESGFNRKAHSSAGARGLWQLIRPTARHYGLTIGRKIDQRIDPLRSTVAAARLLARLKREHKKWPLAITAYNYGTNGMRRAIGKYGHNYMKIRRLHRTSIFRFASKNYYPSFLAVLNLAKKDHSPAIAK